MDILDMDEIIEGLDENCDFNKLSSILDDFDLSDNPSKVTKKFMVDCHGTEVTPHKIIITQTYVNEDDNFNYSTDCKVIYEFDRTGKFIGSHIEN